MRFRRTAALAAAALALSLAVGCGSFKRLAYEGFGGRDDWQHPERVVKTLELEAGDRVADLGAGGGYFTFRLAEAVGPGGRVWAVDVDPDMLGHLAEEAASRGLPQVETVRAEPDDPELPDGEVDLVFTVNTWHHLADHADYFARVRERDLAPGGRVAVIELDGSGWFVRWFGHYTEREAIVDEMAAAGFALAEAPDFLERQHFLLFAPADGADGP